MRTLMSIWRDLGDKRQENGKRKSEREREGREKGKKRKRERAGETKTERAKERRDRVLEHTCPPPPLVCHPSRLQPGRHRRSWSPGTAAHTPYQSPETSSAIAGGGEKK